MRKAVRPPAYDPPMRKAYVVLAGLLLLTIVFQFITAGVLVFEDRGKVEMHGAGAGVAHLWPLGMIIVAAVGKLGRDLIILGVVLLVLAFVQFPIQDTEGLWVIHPLVALIMAFGAHHAMQRARAGDDTHRPAGTNPAPQNPGTPTV